MSDICLKYRYGNSSDKLMSYLNLTSMCVLFCCIMNDNYAFFAGELTMIDGKVLGFLVNEASSCCSFCEATPTEMGDVQSCIKRPLRDGVTEYGISSLHLWMRTADFVLHIAYKLKVKKARVASESKDADKIKKRKERMQTQFYNKMNGLRVDFPSPNGGTTNDGPTCRRLFQDYEVGC